MCSVLQAHVVGEVGADAEAARRAVGEVAVERERALEVEAVGEDQPLGARVDAQLLVVRERLLAPDERVARVVAQAVEELGEVEVEVGQEGVHADDVGERRAEVAAVLLHPGLERGALEVAQAHAERLERLQVLVRHRADRHQAEVAREQHVGRALEELGHLALERRQHLAVPRAREAPAHAEVEELERRRPLRLLAELAQALDLGRQAPATFGERRAGVEAAEVELVDDRQHEDLERHHVDLRPDRDDLERLAVGARARADEVALEVEDAQEVDEVRADEAQAPQVGELVGPEAQRAEGVELAVDLGEQLGERKRRLVAADEGVLGLRLPGADAASPATS